MSEERSPCFSVLIVEGMPTDRAEDERGQANWLGEPDGGKIGVGRAEFEGARAVEEDDVVHGGSSLIEINRNSHFPIQIP